MKKVIIDMQKSLLRIIGIPALILMIPFIAMQFSNEVNWDETDFIVVGVLLVVAVSAFELIMKKAGKYKIAAGIAVILAALWLYAELAVGLFTNWGS
jgi:hypothetical protein